MPIRWSARQVSESLDKMDKILDELEPILQRLLDKASETGKLPNLPEYMGQPLGWVKEKTSDFYAGQKKRIEKVRAYIPKDDLAREQAQFQKWVNLFDGDKERAEVAMNLGRPETRKEVPKEQARMGFAYQPTDSRLVQLPADPYEDFVFEEDEDELLPEV